MKDTELLLPSSDDDEPRAELVEEGAPLWTTTFGDMMSLLLTFFVLLYSMSELKQDKFLQASQSLREAIGGSSAEIPDDPQALLDLEMDPSKYLDDPQGGATGDPVVEALADAYMEVIAKRLEKFIAENELEDEFTVDREEEGIFLRIQSSALFGSGSGTLNAAGLPMLGYLGEITSSLDVRAVVSGHADNDPISTAQFASNWELSAARAAGVARQLVAYGQDPEMVRVESFGEYRPVASNDTPEGRALNRRVEVFFARSDIIEAARRWAATGEPVPEFASSDEAPATGGAGIVDVIGGSEGG